MSLQRVFGIFGCVDSVVCVKRKAGLEESGGVRRYAAPGRLNTLAWPEIAALRSSDHEIRSGQLSGQGSALTSSRTCDIQCSRSSGGFNV